MVHWHQYAAKHAKNVYSKWFVVKNDAASSTTNNVPAIGARNAVQIPHAAPVAITNGNFGLYVEISDTHYYVSNFKEDNGGGGGLAGGGVSGVIYVYKISDGSLEFTLGKSADDFTSVQNGNFGVGLCLEGNSLLASQGNATWDPTYYPRAYVFE